MTEVNHHWAGLRETRPMMQSGCMLDTGSLEHVGTFLRGTEIARILAVSSFFRATLDTVPTWRRLCSRCPDPDVVAVDGRVFELRIMTLDELRSLYRTLLYFKALEVPCNVIVEGVFQSSADDDLQTIAETLDDAPETFWSSAGSITEDCDDLLVYRLAHALSVVQSVEIKPFRARYQQGMQCYAPVRARVVIRLFEDDPDSETHASEWKMLDNEDRYATFDLGSVLAVGAFLRIEMAGRRTRQLSDGLFYSCLESVVAKGVPVAVLSDDVPFIRLLHSRVSRHVSVAFDRFCEQIAQHRTSAQKEVGAANDMRLAFLRVSQLVVEKDIPGVVSIVTGFINNLAFRDAAVLLVDEHCSEFVNEYVAQIPSLGSPVPVSKEETYAVAKKALSGDRDLFEDLRCRNMLYLSEQLGDLFFNAKDYSQAAACYAACHIPDKIISTYSLMCQHPHLVRFLVAVIVNSHLDDRVLAVEGALSLLASNHHPMLNIVPVAESPSKEINDLVETLSADYRRNAT
ncbi:unnamed protein product (mitochondrion) [Plasmodiophora brassicae]|uniref:F-box domain-containing protein n=1 Tax=Plasmodiophora brassicae TaxID=37360 RepID=A0A3P3XZV8_PLABS|nr:unnamed protein product [Plasmodiophora brassicae]